MMQMLFQVKMHLHIDEAMSAMRFWNAEVINGFEYKVLLNSLDALGSLESIIIRIQS